MVNIKNLAQRSVLCVRFNSIHNYDYRCGKVQIIKFKSQSSKDKMFKGQCLYLWWSLTLMLGEEATAVSIEKLFECFNLQTEFRTLVGVLNT